MSKSLIAQAESFALELTELVNGTISRNIEFSVEPIEGSEQEEVFVQVRGKSTFSPKLIPVTSDLTDSQEPWLWLKVQYRFALKGAHKYLTVKTSIFSLIVDSETNNPVIRIEYERGAGSEPDDLIPGSKRRNAAHVHIHGESQLLGYIQGRRAVEKIKPLHKFHFPVGGKRYRPSLEDFIEFLYAEEIVVALNSGFKELLKRNRDKWLAIQLKATVLNSPELAIAQLEEMGYKIIRSDG